MYGQTFHDIRPVNHVPFEILSQAKLESCPQRLISLEEVVLYVKFADKRHSLSPLVKVTAHQQTDANAHTNNDLEKLYLIVFLRCELREATEFKSGEGPGIFRGASIFLTLGKGGLEFF